MRRESQKKTVLRAKGARRITVNAQSEDADLFNQFVYVETGARLMHAHVERLG